MGSKLKMNTSFRPQMHGQTKRVNLVIQQFLRNYVVWINKIGWTIWSWLGFAITIRNTWQQKPPLFKW